MKLGAVYHCSMLSTITGLKEDLAKLAGVLNQFKSEAVQVKLLEQFFAIGPAPGSELVNPVATTKTRRGRPPKVQAVGVQSTSAPATKRGKRSAMGATGALNALLSKGYFKSRRTIADIVQACESKVGVSIRSPISLGLSADSFRMENCSAPRTRMTSLSIG